MDWDFIKPGGSLDKYATLLARGPIQKTYSEKLREISLRHSEENYKNHILTLLENEARKGKFSYSISPDYMTENLRTSLEKEGFKIYSENGDFITISWEK